MNIYNEDEVRMRVWRGSSEDVCWCMYNVFLPCPSGDIVNLVRETHAIPRRAIRLTTSPSGANTVKGATARYTGANAGVSGANPR